MNVRLTYRVHKLFGRVPLIRAIGHWRSDRRFRRWRARNPGATYADYYAASVSRKMRQGKAHYTLGSRGWTPGHGPAVEWDADSFAERGMRLWHQIHAFGLEPGMRCVDYGCGSLRLGQHAIGLSRPGQLLGHRRRRDVHRGGDQAHRPRLVPGKTASLRRDRRLHLDEIGRWRPDFIFSNAVLQHVPPEELGVYFERLARMMAPETRAYVLVHFRGPAAAHQGDELGLSGRRTARGHRQGRPQREERGSRSRHSPCRRPRPRGPGNPPVELGYS